MQWCMWLLFLSHPFTASCYRILLVPGHNAISHAKSLYLVGEALKKTGNEVHLLQMIADRTQVTRNQVGVVDRVLYVPPNSSDLDTSKVAKEITWTSRHSEQASIITTAWMYTTESCVRILANDSTRDELSSIWNEHWDAVIFDDFTACGTAAVANELANRSIVIVDYKLVPRLSLKPGEDMIPIWETSSYDVTNFFYRLGTTLQGLRLELLFRDLESTFASEHVYLRNFDMSLIDRIRTFTTAVVPTGLEVARPRTLDSVEFDMDCPKSGELPEQFRTFVEDAQSRGTILFAMGHYASWDGAPREVIDSFVQAFSKLPHYRIIWQFNAGFSLENLTSNVLLGGSWIPQTAILNHHKTKLFISHMGVKSAREVVCARVPVLALPMFADQFRNSLLAQYRGYGLYIDKTRLSAEYVYQSIRRVLDEPNYYTAVQRVQERLNDTIRKPSSLFTYNMEFFIRRNKERILSRFIKPKLIGADVVDWTLAAMLVITGLVAVMSML